MYRAYFDHRKSSLFTGGSFDPGNKDTSIIIYKYSFSLSKVFLISSSGSGENITHQNHVDDRDDQLRLIDLRSITLCICFLSVNIARYFKPINLRSDGIRSLNLNGNLSLKDLKRLL